MVGRDPERLAADLAPWRADPRYRWETVEPGLEDVFIHLMRTAKNAQRGRAMNRFFSWSRWRGILGKEFIQLKRDRLTFAMIVGIPVIQLVLFGFASV